MIHHCKLLFHYTSQHSNLHQSISEKYVSKLKKKYRINNNNINIDYDLYVIQL